jgi:hypothetical protein
MSHARTSLLQQALEAVDKLPLADQETLVDLVQRRLVELRRTEISHNATATLRAVHEGHARYGGIDDLKRDLLGDS